MPLEPGALAFWQGRDQYALNIEPDKVHPKSEAALKASEKANKVDPVQPYNDFLEPAHMAVEHSKSDNHEEAMKMHMLSHNIHNRIWEFFRGRVRDLPNSKQDKKLHDVHDKARKAHMAAYRAHAGTDKETQLRKLHEAQEDLSGVAEEYRGFTG